MGDNKTQQVQSSLTSANSVLIQDVTKSTPILEISTTPYSVHRTSLYNSDLQTALKSSQGSQETVQYSTLYYPATLQPSSTVTPPLTSFTKPYKTSDLKITSHSSSLDKSSSVQLTNIVSSSSSTLVTSSIIFPVIPPSKPTTTNGNVSSPTSPSAFTDNLTLILGLSLCGVAVIILLIIILFICCRKRTKNKQQTVETVQIGDLWASNRGDISFAPTFDSVLDTVSESPKVKEKSNKADWSGKKKYRIEVFYHVLYPYTAQDDGQLNLDLGDVVTLIEKRNNGWWKGKVRDKEGWFPGSYVEEAEIGIGYANHNSHNGLPSPSVSSFMKNQDLTPKLTKNSNNRNSAPVFSSDKKILGKEVPIPKVPTPTISPFKSPKSSKPISPVHITGSTGKIVSENVDGIRFLVLYGHDPSFSNELKIEPGDVVTGIEKDKNGWMKGRQEKSGEIGMFPSIYVQEITDEDIGGYQDKQSVYDKLPVYSDTSTGEFIGVEHVAVCPYAAENETDLSFDMGDTIIVCQTLDNGWWYGCDGDQYGWFPGSYVEAIKQDQMVEDEFEGPFINDTTQERETTEDNIPECTVICDKPLEDSMDKDIAALSPIKPPPGHKSEDEMSQKSVDSVEKRAISSNSKAKDSPKKSRLPTVMRPTRPAPPPPPHHHSTPESKTNLMDKFNKAKNSDEVNKKETPREKPVVPKRYIKPKLRKVPKKKTKAGNESELCRRKVRSPPPPRPDPPKLFKDKSFNQNDTGENIVKKSESISDSMVDDSIAKIEVDVDNVNNEISLNQSVVAQDDSQNLANFTDNSLMTDNSFGKMSGLTSLSSSVQGERTHDQSELTSVSGINMSDLNDSKLVSNKYNSIDNSQSVDVSGFLENESRIDDSVSEENKMDADGNHDDNAECKIQTNQKIDQKSESKLPCKLPQPKSHSVGTNSPSEIPKSQILRSNSHKPPPVAPKPSRGALSPSKEPLYSEVGSKLVGSDIVDGNSNKIELYKRPTSPIYSKIDKKYVAPSKMDSMNSSNNGAKIDFNDEKRSSQEIEEESISSRIILDTSNDRKFSDGHISDQLKDNDEKSSQNAEIEVDKSGGSDTEINSMKEKSPKVSAIPGPVSAHTSNIPKKVTSPALKKKTASSSIPKPNIATNGKVKNESHDESGHEKDSKNKPERPSRPPQVSRKSSLPSPSPSRLRKVEKSQSLRSESPKTGSKQRQKMAKEGSKIPSGIPISPKQKTSNPANTAQTGSGSSRLPRKTVNGVVSPKPKRPPPPKSPPLSPDTASPNQIHIGIDSNHMNGGDHSSVNGLGNKPNTDNLFKRTKASYTPENDSELAFEEGCFIREISRDDETGICIGMLPSGETGLYHSSYVEDSSNEQQSVV